jgi:transposase InsO family protein
LTLPVMRELSVAEQRYRAVLEVVAEGRTVTEVAVQWRVSRQTLHGWLKRYEESGLDGLADRSRRPGSCPHQMSGQVEAVVLELRRLHGYWGPRRIRVELERRRDKLGLRGVDLPSESGVYRALLRAGLIDPDRRRRRRETWKRWERGAANELWQFDVVGGFLLGDGTKAKALTGVDDHSRFCVSARLMPRERTQLVCEGFRAALATYGVPQQVLTDNGKVFTGKYAHPPVEVLWDRICREHGIEHLLTKPRSPTTTGKIERFHRTLRTEFDTARTFPTLAAAQAELDEWVRYYNHERPHQSLEDEVPAARFGGHDAVVPQQRSARRAVKRSRGSTRGSARGVEVVQRPAGVPQQPGEQWVARRITTNGVVSVAGQVVCVGKHYAGSRADVLVKAELLQFWVAEVLVKTVARTNDRPVRWKNAAARRAKITNE